jgi:hypothetical protein
VRRITRPLLVLLAIIFLVEAWLWRHLEPIVEQIVGWLPLRAVKARLAGFIRKLPPAATLVVFIIPVVALFPLKMLGLWLLAHKHWIAAGAVLIFAKLVGLGITAFVFEATRPKLLQLQWFRWLYEHVLLWLDWARSLVAPIRDRIRRLLRIFRAKQTGRALRLLWRIRRRMRADRKGLSVPLSANAAGGVRSVQTP